MDFAENYYFLSVEKVKYAYLNSKMSSLDLFVAYLKTNSLLLNKKFVFVSDEISLDAYIV